MGDELRIDDRLSIPLSEVELRANLISIGARRASENSSTYLFHSRADVILPARSHAKPAQ